MSTPFDAAIAAIAAQRYHNHRLEDHSDIICDGIVADLIAACPAFRADLDSATVRIWKNVSSPGDRERRVNLFIGGADAAGQPDPRQVRVAVENKSVITAHRNRTNRFDDLKKVVAAVQRVRPEAIVIATILVGLAERVLNIPDQVHKFFRDRENEFAARVVPRFSSGDASLFEEFSWAVSVNRPTDPQRTCDQFRELPTRGVAQTHEVAFDAVLLVPVFVDNVHRPTIARPNPLGIDVDREYRKMIERACRAYTARWHM